MAGATVKTLAAFTPAVRQLGEDLNCLAQENEATHQELVSGLQLAAEQIVKHQACLRQDGEQNQADLVAYQSAVQHTTHSLVEGLAGSQTDITGLLEAAVRGYDEQYQNQTTASQTEAQLDHLHLAKQQSLCDELVATEAVLKMVQADLYRMVEAEEQILQTQQEETVLAVQQASRRFNQQAIQMYARGHIAMARELFNRAKEVDPQSGQVFLNLAGLEAYQGRLNQATDHYREAMKLGMGENQQCFVQALIAYRQDEPEIACRDLEQILKSGCSISEELDIHLWLAQIYYQSGFPIQAVENWQRVLDLDPGHPVAQAWMWAILGIRCPGDDVELANIDQASKKR